jgi:transcription elongation factor GreA
MKKLYQITSEGKKELERELGELKAGRGAIAEKIADARGYGDLSENAEYDSAREAQGLLESRVAEIEDILLNAEIMKSGSKSKVGMGSKVTLKSGAKEVTYIVVGPVEADPIAGRISNESPIGKSIYGKKVGDDIEIVTPKLKIQYTIASIG